MCTLFIIGRGSEAIPVGERLKMLGYKNYAYLFREEARFCSGLEPTEWPEPYRAKAYSRFLELKQKGEAIALFALPVGTYPDIPGGDEDWLQGVPKLLVHVPVVAKSQRVSPVKRKTRIPTVKLHTERQKFVRAIKKVMQVCPAYCT